MIIETKTNFGYRMEYPTKVEAKHFSRELSWEERFEVLFQGYNRGVMSDYCYTLEYLTNHVSRRNPKDPAGGVRSLDKEKLIPWVRDCVGDKELARVLEKIYSEEIKMATIIDKIRVVLITRVNQYSEVLDEGVF